MLCSSIKSARRRFAGVLRTHNAKKSGGSVGEPPLKPVDYVRSQDFMKDRGS
jgi:hypothetical protein